SGAAPNRFSSSLSKAPGTCGQPLAWVSDQPVTSSSVNEGAVSATQPLSLGIEEHRRDDARPHVLALHRKDGDHLAPLLAQAALIEAEGDGFSERRAEGGGGHAPAPMAGNGVAGREQERPGAQAFAVFEAFEADEARPLRIGEGRPAREHPPAER